MAYISKENFIAFIDKKIDKMRFIMNDLELIERM